MVTLYEDNENNDMKYAKNPITKNTFLTSLYDHPQGIDCQCISISPILENKLKDNKPSVIVNIRILDYMPNCKAYEVGEDGKYVEIYDELNKPQKILTSMNGQGQEVALNFNLKESDQKPDEFTIGTLSGFYPLIRYALIVNDVIPNNYHNKIDVSHDDMDAYLPLLKFNATVKRETPKNFPPYNVLIAGKPHGHHDDGMDDNGFVIPPQSK